MSWNVCKFDLCESWTRRKDGDYCASHERANAKEEQLQKQATEKRKKQIEKAKAKNQEPRKTISKNPLDWSNTFLCSSGNKVTQAEITRFRNHAYHVQAMSRPVTTCEGCGKPATCRAHIIAQARCKQIGKTELIWHTGNFFPSCYDCNSAIENPKGNDWQQLKNISYCLSFIEKHDKELFAKFESRLATTEPHKI